MARREKKACLSEQCKEIEGEKQNGKDQDLFKKIQDVKGTFHVKMSTIKNRNDMDLTEAEATKKRYKKTQKNCTKRS